MPNVDKTFIIPADIPAVNAATLDSDIRTSSIVTALDGITITETLLTITFKGTLSSEDETTLHGDILAPAGGLLALHDPASIAPAPFPVEIATVIGGEDIVQDGASISHGLSTWTSLEYLLNEDLYLMSALICWDNWKADDYGYAAVTNPAAEKDLTSEAASGQATLELGVAGVALYYNPAVIGKPVCVEIWSESGGNKVDLIERRWVSSVSGSVVTLDTNLTQTHAVGSICVPCYGLYSEVRGTDGTEGGIHLIGSGSATLGNTSQLAKSELVTTGLCFSIRLRTSAVAGTRLTSVTFLMRRPEV